MLVASGPLIPTFAKCQPRGNANVGIGPLVETQMILPQLLPLDAAKRAVGQPLWRRPVVNHMQRKALAEARENANRSDRLASGPQTKLSQAIPR